MRLNKNSVRLHVSVIIIQNVNIKSANIEPETNSRHIRVSGECGIVFESN